MHVLGVDVGGSGVKGAIVDIEKGSLVSERIRIPTPQPATPQAVAETFAALVSAHQWQGPIGCGFPAAMQHGVARTAANIDKSWIGQDAQAIFSAITNCPVTVINDADAAGYAEMRFGAGKNMQNKNVMIVTLGTGIGSALFCNGQLYPNTELGHLEMNGMEVEHFAASSIRKSEGLSWEEWGGRLNQVLQQYSALFWPDCLILGGGVSKKFHKFQKYLHCEAELLPAELLNNAGIVGAAVAGKK